jgi:septum formation inhibitor-activating ATPase MinD
MSKAVNVVSNAYNDSAGTSIPPLLIDGNYISAGTSKTLTVQDNHGVVKLDSAAGSTVTLPAATGSGVKFKFVVTTLATTTNHIVQAANSSDVMIGIIFTRDDTAANAEAYASTGTSDTITLNRTTSGGVTRGEWLTAEDIAANTWHVSGFITNTGTSVTPFSAAV